LQFAISTIGKPTWPIGAGYMIVDGAGYMIVDELALTRAGCESNPHSPFGYRSGSGAWVTMSGLKSRSRGLRTIGPDHLQSEST
jgi:hypothetical protein